MTRGHNLLWNISNQNPRGVFGVNGTFAVDANGMLKLSAYPLVNPISSPFQTGKDV